MVETSYSTSVDTDSVDVTTSESAVADADVVLLKVADAFVLLLK